MSEGPGDPAERRDWEGSLRDVITSGSAPVHLVGVGNSLRTDDAVGLEIISALRSRLGAAPTRGLRVHPISAMPERLLSRLASKPGLIVVFDAVESSQGAGTVVFTRLSDTKYGFFATHNVPLQLIPGIRSRGDGVFILGVQPESLEVGEGLTGKVSASARRIADVVAEAAEGRA